MIFFIFILIKNNFISINFDVKLIFYFVYTHNREVCTKKILKRYKPLIVFHIACIKRIHVTEKSNDAGLRYRYVLIFLLNLG